MSINLDNKVVSMMGRYVKIIPKVGEPIIGLFVDEKRLREYTKDLIFVIQISEGVRAFISRDEVSYIIMNDAGFVSEKQIPDDLEKVFEHKT